MPPLYIYTGIPDIKLPGLYQHRPEKIANEHRVRLGCVEQRGDILISILERFGGV